MNSLPATGVNLTVSSAARSSMSIGTLGVAAGWLNPMVHPAQVEYFDLEYFIGSVLPTAPFYGRPVHGAPANVREDSVPTRSTQSGAHHDNLFRD